MNRTYFIVCSVLFTTFLFLLSNPAPISAGDACCPPKGSAVASSPAAPSPVDSHAGHNHGPVVTAAGKPGGETGNKGEEGKKPNVPESQATGHEGHNHGGADAHGSDLDQSIEALKEKSCEHGCKTYTCDKCRFEVGAVKLGSATANLIKVETISETPQAKVLELNGELGFDENHVRAVTTRLSGLLASFSAVVGERVKTGQNLAVLESPELAEAVIDFLKRKAELELAVKKLDRAKLLREKKVGSEQEVQEAQSSRDLAELETRHARDHLAMHGIPDSAITGLSATRASPLLKGRIAIESPIDGVVTQREGVIGEMVPSDRKLLTIASIGNLKATGQIHENQLGPVFEVLKSGAIPVELSVGAFPDKVFHGKLVSAEAQVVDSNRTLPVRIQVDNRDSLLRPGMFAKIKLYLESRQNQVTLPVSAVLEDGGATFIFQQVEPNLFFRRSVVAGRRVGDRIIIQSGIKAGAAVAIDGVFLMKSDVLREKMGAGCAD